MKLTKKSEEKLLKYPIGNGVIFIKTGEKTMQIIKFYLAKNNKFYLADSASPIELIKTLSNTIKEITRG